MSIFAISDLHLSLGCDKPMDVFGSKWLNYTERMRKNWNSIVTASDYVIIPGDISWATYIDDAVRDFEYINNLNGKKILLKGNHDYWWTTASKMTKFFEKNNFDTIRFVQNNSVIISDNNRKIAICGTRGWIIPPLGSIGEDRKIFEREKQRLVLSFQDALRSNPDKIIAAMHYPPVEKDAESSDFIRIMSEFNADECVFGLLHAASHINAPHGVYGGIRLRLVSCDYLNFVPLLILK